MTKMTSLAMASLLALCGCASAPKGGSTSPSAGDVGTISFASTGSLDEKSDGKLVPGAPVTISGDLQFPPGPGPFPAVVLAHGCGGIGYAEKTWVPFPHEWGYATFVVDSFKPRGLTSVCTNLRRLRSVRRIPDVYGALKVLATDPKIDAHRVALMGFSQGGVLTLLAATVWAKETYAPVAGASFRAFFPFYPYCNQRIPEQEHVSAPVRIHAGALDDWTPAKPCEELATSLRSASYDATIVVYPNAFHGFDEFGPVARLPNVDNLAKCYPKFATILAPVDPASITGCMTKGATIGKNPAAVEQAKKNLREQLDVLMKG